MSFEKSDQAASKVDIGGLGLLPIDIPGLVITIGSHANDVVEAVAHTVEECGRTTPMAVKHNDHGEGARARGHADQCGAIVAVGLLRPGLTDGEGCAIHQWAMGCVR